LATVLASPIRIGQEQRTLMGPRVIRPSAVFSPDGKRIATTHWNATLNLWEADEER
jgi:hypothetical protein